MGAEGQCLEEYELILGFILRVEERLPVRNTGNDLQLPGLPFLYLGNGDRNYNYDSNNF